MRRVLADEMLLILVTFGLVCVLFIEGSSLWRSFCSIPECQTCGHRLAVGQQFGTYCQRCDGPKLKYSAPGMQESSADPGQPVAAAGGF